MDKKITELYIDKSGSQVAMVIDGGNGGIFVGSPLDADLLEIGALSSDWTLAWRA